MIARLVTIIVIVATPAPKHSSKPGSRPGSIERLGTPEPIIAYDRDLYGYESYPTHTKSGFYTGRSCDTNIDHVVSLKDAHESGAEAGLLPNVRRFLMIV